jgi:Double zinc ribbon
MKHCQQCNLDFPDSFRFCGSCGGALRDSVYCQGCGELVESKWTFCTNCGGELSSQSTSAQASSPKAPKPSDMLDAPKAALSNPSTFPPETIPLSGLPSVMAAPEEWYAAPDLFEETTQTTATPIPRRDLIPKTTVAVPGATAHPQSGNGKTSPTLTMLAAYGKSETNASPEWSGWPRLLVGLFLLIFFGLIGLGGWYWWTHRALVAQSPVQADSNQPPAAADSSSSASSASSATTATARITTSEGAEEEWKQLKEKRIGTKPSESGAIIAAFEDAEKKYPTDYRFPYERAKLSIKGIISHHEAFEPLSLAAEKAIDNGKAQEMLNNLEADKDGDFYKLSRGHHEWMALEEALRNKDKGALKALHH